MQSLVAIELLADERVDSVLRTLAAGPLAPKDLEHAIPSVPHTSLNDLLRDLDRRGVVLRRPAKETACGTVQHELSEAGIDLIHVFDVAANWGLLASGPAERVPVTAMAKALAAGWEAGIVSLLSMEPRSRGELTQHVRLTHHQVEGRIAALVKAGLTEQVGRGKPLRYAFTEHGREGVSIVVEGIMWEHWHGSPNVGAPEQFARALSVALPLLEFAEDVEGVCTLTLEDSGAPAAAAVTVEIADGRVVSSARAQQAPPSGWARGEMEAWLCALRTGGRSGLSIAGDQGLVEEIVDGLSMRLFAVERSG